MDSKALVRTLIDDVFNKRDLSRLEDYCAENCVFHDPMASTASLAELRGLFEGYHATFPDVSVIVDAQVAEGDLVATRMTAVANATGALPGRVDRQKVRMAGIQVDRVRDGRIAETWVQMDYRTLLQELVGRPRAGAWAQRQSREW